MPIEYDISRQLWRAGIRGEDGSFCTAEFGSEIQAYIWEYEMRAAQVQQLTPKREHTPNMEEQMRISHRLQLDYYSTNLQAYYYSILRDWFADANQRVLDTETSLSYRDKYSVASSKQNSLDRIWRSCASEMASEDQRFFFDAVNKTSRLFVKGVSSVATTKHPRSIERRIEFFDKMLEEASNYFFVLCARRMLADGMLSEASEKKVIENIINGIPVDSIPDYAIEAGNNYFNNLTTIRKDFYLFFCPFFKAKEGSYVTLLPVSMLKGETVTCMVTGAEVSKRKAMPVADGGYISAAVWSERPDLKNEYGQCEFEVREIGKSAPLHRLKYLVAVYNKSNHFAHRKVSVEKAKANFTFYEKTGRYYNFDINKNNCYLIGEGWFTEKDLTGMGCKFEEDVGAWVHVGNFNLLPHSEDVLNFFNGFRHMPYEETVRNNPNYTLNTLFMGMELEVEMSRKATLRRNEAARQAVLDMKGHAIVVSDGSLDNGFEVVSVPATLNYHYGMWEKLLRGSLRKQIVSYMRASCGIHIHLSKEAFSPLSLGKFITFINSVENQKFIESISQRVANRYNERPVTKISKGKNRDAYTDSNGRRYNKYVSCNLDKEHTVEVRIFKGTLAYPQVMKNLEFCHALHKYVTHHASNTQLKYTDFCAWLVKKNGGNRKAYPYLYDYLKMGKFIEDKFRPASSMTKDDVTDSMAESGEEGIDRVTEIPATKLDYIRRAGGSRNTLARSSAKIVA